MYLRPAATAVLLALCACASPHRSLTLRVALAPDANDHMPVPVDVVFVWDDAVAAKVGALTAAQWFSTKAQFRLDDPKGRALTICEWEWVPDQVVPEINLAVPVSARRWNRGVFVFANYRTGGTHRSALTLGSAALLELRKDEARVRLLDRSAAPAVEWLETSCPAASPASAPGTAPVTSTAAAAAGRSAS